MGKNKLQGERERESTSKTNLLSGPVWGFIWSCCKLISFDLAKVFFSVSQVLAFSMQFWNYCKPLDCSRKYSTVTKYFPPWHPSSDSYFIYITIYNTINSPYKCLVLSAVKNLLYKCSSNMWWDRNRIYNLDLEP